MSNFTPVSVFGASVAQDANTLTISKLDLAQNTGFTPTTQNDGESLLAAIIIQALNLGLTTASRDGNDSSSANFNQQVAINGIQTSFITRDDEQGNSVWFKRDSLIIDFDLPLPVNVDPNSY